MKSHRAYSLTIAVAAVCVFLASSGLSQTFSPAATAMREAARQAGVPEKYLPRETPAESRAKKLSREPWEQKITTMVRDRLAILEENGILRDGRRQLAPQFATLTVQIDDQARLRVECKVDDVTPFDDVYLRSIGGELVVRAPGYGLLVAWIPAEQMKAFAGRPDVRLIMHIDPPFTDVGIVETEGDSIHRADESRATFGISGAGQFVGAISDGVVNLAFSQSTGDLPLVIVPPGGTGGGDEGTAMLEIIHDLAPDALLAFNTGHPGMASMINAINTLAALPGMTIITDDLPKPGEPLFENGPIAQAKQNAVAAGIFYTASAGNRGNQHYEGNFNSTASDVTIGPNTYDHPHDFGGGDFLLSITVGSSNSIYLQWADPFGASGNDIDLYVLDAAGDVLASSTDLQDGTQDPNESVSFGATPGTAANILVDYVGGGDPPTAFFDLRAFGDVTWNEYLMPQGSINGASRQAEVYAAGASDAANPTAVRGFSSKGPINHFFPAPITRMKPDGVAVNGVSITGAGGFGSGTCPMVAPGDCRFYGTSASTPHVAGLAALMLEACPGLTPAQVADFFNTTALDIDLPGPDNNAGYGLLDVFDAIFPPIGFTEDAISNDFYPPDPWVQDGLVIDTVCVVPVRNLLNLRFFSDPLQCGDVPCEPGDVKKIHEDLIEFVPDEIAYVTAGETLCVEVKISVPVGQHACNYGGVIHAIAETEECLEKLTDDLAASVNVHPTVDLDVDDNHGNVSDNVMTLKGAKETSVHGTFTVVNPNSEVKNVDLPDGPGNIRIEPISVSSTDLVKIGDPAVSIGSENITFGALSSLASGEAKDVQIDVSIPGGLPINAVYEGTITVVYDECVHSRRPNRRMLGAGPVSDEFTLRLELLPTQGILDITETSLDGEFCPPDPWTQVGQIEYAFEISAEGDHRNIRLSSGGLKHDSLDKKLDDFNFFPEEIAFLAAGETREVQVITKVPIGQHEGTYSGFFRVVSENGGEDSVLATAEICTHPDLDVQDDLANLSSNILHLEGPREGIAYGTFSVVNPNLPENNADLYDGPGNLALEDLVAIPSDLLFAAGGPSPKEPIPASMIDIEILPDASHLPSGAGAYGIVQVSIPKKSQHWVPGYNFEYWGDVEVRGYVPGDSVSDGFKIELRVLKAIGGGLLSGFWGEETRDSNILHWSDLGLMEYGYSLYRNDLKIAELGEGVYEYADPTANRSVLEYRLGVKIDGSEIMIGPIYLGGAGLPAVFSLSQNHPNPSGGRTNISYQIPEPAHVSLGIYDVSGRLIRVLEESDKAAGFYTVEWDGRDDLNREAGNGVYFYRLVSGDFSKNLKMILLR